jgi:hypothetical protein
MPGSDPRSRRCRTTRRPRNPVPPNTVTVRSFVAGMLKFASSCRSTPDRTVQVTCDACLLPTINDVGYLRIDGGGMQKVYSSNTRVGDAKGRLWAIRSGSNSRLLWPHTPDRVALLPGGTTLDFGRRTTSRQICLMIAVGLVSRGDSPRTPVAG